MVEKNISPISYSLRFEDREKMKEKTAEVIRNVQKLEQKKIIICSPREEKYKLIEVVLDEVGFFVWIYSFLPNNKILDLTCLKAFLGEK